MSGGTTMFVVCTGCLSSASWVRWMYVTSVALWTSSSDASLGGRLLDSGCPTAGVNGDAERGHAVHDSRPGVWSSLGEKDECVGGQVVRLPTRRLLHRSAVGKELVRGSTHRSPSAMPNRAAMQGPPCDSLRVRERRKPWSRAKARSTTRR
ncbi:MULTISPECIES: hypothetical protein [Streptomyces]|nr:hypothetical protein [Streptomyces sp. SID5464]